MDDAIAWGVAEIGEDGAVTDLISLDDTQPVAETELRYWRHVADSGARRRFELVKLIKVASDHV